MAQFDLKIEKLSHIIGARGFQDLRSPMSPIMAPGSSDEVGGSMLPLELPKSNLSNRKPAPMSFSIALGKGCSKTEG